MRVSSTQLSILLLTAALMLLTHLCGGQSSTGCPIEIRRAKWQAIGPGFSPHKTRGVALHLQYMNVTDEEMREVVFDAATSYREHGAMGQSMLENGNKTPITATAPPKKWKKAEIDVGLSEPGRTRLRIAEVSFSNGRHWVNPAADECEWSIAP